MARPLVLAGAGVLAGYLYFQRRPTRRVPPDPAAVVSPANGRVIHLERVETPEVAFFKKDVLNSLTMVGMAPPFRVVVIELDLFDVHLQRAPVAGRVVVQQYFPGQHQNALLGDTAHLVRANEKQLTVIAGPLATVGVVQVAGLVARRIHVEVQPGQDVAKGQPIGTITFGSQVVLVLPDTAALAVQVGSRVTDGETTVARLSAALPATPPLTLQNVG